MIYVASSRGWMMVIDAPDARSALRRARNAAAGASLLRSDIQLTHIRQASDEEVAWYRVMSAPRDRS